MLHRTGDWVEVRSKEEILHTLDVKGRLDGLPFMPQMFQYCGQRFRVYKRAHKTCDTVNGTGGRRLASGLHLDLRCDGDGLWRLPSRLPDLLEGGLGQAGRRASDGGPRQPGIGAGIAIDLVHAPRRTYGGRARSRRSAGRRRDQVYACQATQLPRFTSRLPWWDVRQYVEDHMSGNRRCGRLLQRLLLLDRTIYVAQPRRNRLGRPSRWLYDRFQSLRGGVPYPRTRGLIPLGRPTPISELNLQPGELVRVKSHKEILATIDKNFFNRGLFFDAELVPNCGKTFRVQDAGEQVPGRKDRKDENAKNPGRHSAGCLVRIPLQQLQGVLPQSHLFVVARDLARKDFRAKPGTR